MDFRPGTPRQNKILTGVAIVLTTTVFCGWIVLRFGINAPPSATGDELSYDSMAWELSRGNGYAVDFGQSEFRAPYDEAAGNHPDLYTVSTVQSGPIAFRPPLFSTIGAALNLLLGRQFYALRCMNILLMATTIGMVVKFVHREAGLMAAIFGLLICLIDVRTRLYARSLLTEPLACLLATLLTLVFLSLTEKNSRSKLIIAGILTGCSILTRSIVVVWLPGLALVLCSLLRTKHRCSVIEIARAETIFATTILIVIAPWCVRNIQILERFAPMGTQGLMELSAGYSDVAINNNGVWQNLAARGAYDAVHAANLSNIEFELAIADISKARAIDWIQRNPEKLVPLAFMKIRSEFRPRNTIEIALSVLAVIGLCTCSRTIGAVFIGLLATNAVSIAATWSVEGRFLVPQLFILHSLAAFGATSIISRMLRSPNSGATAPEAPAAVTE